MFFATFTAGITQRFAVIAWETDPYAAFIRTALIGMWATSTSAAGIISFERRRGTLLYLFTSRTSRVFVLIALISSVSVFSLLSFPLATLIWIIPGHGHLSMSLLLPLLPHLIFLMTLSWAGLFGVTLIVACIFVLTTHAMAYESLLLTPLLLFSGVLWDAQGHSLWEIVIRSISPTMRLFSLMYKLPVFLSSAEGFTCSEVLYALGTITGWTFFGCSLCILCAHHAYKSGKIGAR
ncbi:hypothetical protein [Schaalia sp. lx-260]|uniref:hypothetical protein n=1 Tax=Schaalia sp. lx-260 TaxID=2899082 RepID=UPI001E2EFD67|nr:hypothetical protein [Schaalia sp. lx-260]MCD4549217.1 hypothetical protein [Schaalia sp. lx-260]